MSSQQAATELIASARRKKFPRGYRNRRQEDDRPMQPPWRISRQPPIHLFPATSAQGNPCRSAAAARHAGWSRTVKMVRGCVTSNRNQTAETGARRLAAAKTANRAKPARCETTSSGRLPGNKPHSRFQMQISQSIDATGREMRLVRSYKLVSLFSNRRECSLSALAQRACRRTLELNWFFTGRRFRWTRRELPLGATAANASNRLPLRILSKLNQTAIGIRFSRELSQALCECRNADGTRSVSATLDAASNVGKLSAKSL